MDSFTISVPVEFLALLNEVLSNMEPPRESLIDDCDLARLYDEFYQKIWVDR